MKKKYSHGIKSRIELEPGSKFEFVQWQSLFVQGFPQNIKTFKFRWANHSYVWLICEYACKDRDEII